VLGLSAKICPRAFGLGATLDPRVIFIILNLLDLSLSESDCNTGPKNLEYGYGCKVVS
jgi:hypothetical protein